MSDNRRDIELRIRAQDLSTADFTSVAKSVNTLASAIDQETEAAKKGAVSLAELRDTMTKLKQAGDALTNIAALIDRFKNLGGVVSANQTKVEEASSALGAYRASIEAAGDTSAAAEKKLNALVKTLQTAEEKFSLNSKSLASAGEALAKSGVDVLNLATAENELRAVADQIGPSLTRLSEAHVNYAKNVRVSREETAALRAEQEAQAAAIKEQIAQEQAAAAAVAEFNNQTKALADQRRQQQATQAKDQVATVRASLKQQAADLAAFNDETHRLTAERTADALAQQRAQIDGVRASLIDQKRRWDEVTASVAKFNEQTRQQTRERQNAPAQAQVAQLRQSSAVPTGAAPATGRPAPRQVANQQNSFLGLRPYELTNLSYQINDVVTQLASGTSLLQTFAQQGGQIFQLFEKNIFDFAKYLPVVAVAVAGVTVAVSALVEAMHNASAIRTFQADLALSVNGLGYNAAKMVEIVHSVKEFGVSFADGVKAARDAVEQGLNEDKLKSFLIVAQNLADADVNGKKLTETMHDLLVGIGGNYDAIVKLGNEYGGFNPQQLALIRSLFDAGKAAQAQAVAFDILAAKAKDASDKALSPFEKEVRQLTSAWGDLIENLSKSTLLQGTVDLLTSLVTKLTELVKLLNANPQINVPAMSGEGLPGVLQIGGALPAPKPPPNIAAGNLNPQGNVAIPPAAVSTPAANDTVSQAASTAIAAALKFQGEKLKDYCAHLVNDALKAAGIPGSGSNLASSFKTFGQSVSPDQVKAGDVFYHGPSGEGDTGHVGMTLGPVVNGKVQVMSSHLQGPASNPAGVEYRNASDLTFRRPNYGAAGTAAAPADPNGMFHPTSTELSQTEQLLNTQKEQLKTLSAITDQQTLAAEKIKLQREFDQANATASAKNPDVQKQKDLFVQNGLLVKQAELQRNTVAFTKQINDSRITDGKNANEIEAAGYAAAEKARKDAAGGLIDQEQYRAAFLAGEEEKRKSLQQTDKKVQESANIVNTISQLARQVDLKDSGNITAAVSAATEQFTRAREAIAKFQTDFPTATNLPTRLDPQGGTIASTNARLDSLQNTAAQQAEAEARLKNINDLIAQRNTLIAEYKSLEDSGTISAGEAEDKTREAFEKTTPAITDATAKFQEFLSTANSLDPTKVDLYKAKIQEFNAQAKYTSPLFKDIKTALEGAFSTGLSNAFNSIGSAIGGVIAGTQKWKDVLTATRNAALQFFGDLLKAIAEAILKYEGLQIASSLFGIPTSAGGSLLGGLFGSASGTAASGGLFSAGGLFGSQGALFGNAADASIAAGGPPLAAAAVLHAGGIAGSANTFRSVPQSWFANAPRYHNGTPAVGLAPDEQAAILRKSEEVLSPDNPRHIANQMPAGSGASSPISIRSVIVQDQSQIPAAMAGADGEKVVVAHMVKNAATLRQVVKG